MVRAQRPRSRLVLRRALERCKPEKQTEPPKPGNDMSGAVYGKVKAVSGDQATVLYAGVGLSAIDLDRFARLGRHDAQAIWTITRG